MKALITGINGQDGHYLLKLLESKNYDVVGIDIKFDPNTTAKQHITDLTDTNKIKQIILDFKPDEIYNLAAESNNLTAFIDPLKTHQINCVLILDILNLLHKQLPSTKLFQAGSSLIFGSCVDNDGYQRETTNKDPKTPYGCDKLAAYQFMKTYRHHFDIFAVNGILYNHESPRRASTFVVPKIIKHIIENYKNKTQTPLILGDINAIRDWSHASDFANAFQLMMGQTNSDDYICSSKIAHSVNDIVNFVFTYLNYTIPLVTDNKLINIKQENNYIGDNTKLLNLGWDRNYNFELMLIDIINFYLNNYESKV